MKLGELINKIIELNDKVSSTKYILGFDGAAYSNTFQEEYWFDILNPRTNDYTCILKGLPSNNEELKNKLTEFKQYSLLNQEVFIRTNGSEFNPNKRYMFESLQIITSVDTTLYKDLSSIFTIVMKNNVNGSLENQWLNKSSSEIWNIVYGSGFRTSTLDTNEYLNIEVNDLPEKNGKSLEYYKVNNNKLVSYKLDAIILNPSTKDDIEFNISTIK